MKLYFDKQCAICGKFFKSAIKCQKYCSQECVKLARLKKAQAKRVTKTYTKKCPVCGKEFETKKSTKVYCSITCKRTENRNAIKADTVKKICVICGKEFETNKPTLIITCSKECSYIRHWQKSNKHGAKKTCLRKCPVCGKEFYPYRPTQIYCSNECRDSERKKRKNEFLKTARLRYKFRNEEYVEIHRDIFTNLLRLIFNRETKKKEKRKPLDDWIKEADTCKLDYGNYRAQIEVFGKSFEQVKNESLQRLIFS